LLTLEPLSPNAGFASLIVKARVLACPGVSWRVLACPGVSWRVLACPGVRSALIFSFFFLSLSLSLSLSIQNNETVVPPVAVVPTFFRKGWLLFWWFCFVSERFRFGRCPKFLRPFVNGSLAAWPFSCSASNLASFRSTTFHSLGWLSLRMQFWLFSTASLAKPSTSTINARAKEQLTWPTTT